MDDTAKHQTHRKVMEAARRCHECDQEALGRCPDCHKGFCQDHFPKQQHSPCAEKQMHLALTQVCYVCGTQVYPDSGRSHAPLTISTNTCATGAGVTSVMSSIPTERPNM